MTKTVATSINGFGRIGRLVFRALIESNRKDVEVLAINDLADLATSAHLLKYDSVHGRLPVDVEAKGNDTLVVNGKSIKFTQLRDPSQLPWGANGIDIVMECSGVFTDAEKAKAHIAAGAKRVLISAPATGDELTVVYGVNHDKLKRDMQIVSNASCTTNCLAPVAHVLHETFGIEHGFMTTIHSYTGDQNTVDTAHKDWHRARAAAVNMIPTSTGAAKAVGKVIPELNGKLDGVSIRVPTPNVSLVDFKVVLKKETSIDDINNAFVAASNGPLKNILETYTEQLVSSDFNHNPASSSVALKETKLIDGKLARVMSWYDNEWGFSNRMLDTASYWGNL